MSYCQKIPKIYNRETVFLQPFYSKCPKLIHINPDIRNDLGEAKDSL